MSDAPFSLQLIASTTLGGAERWCLRFAAALAERGAPVELGVRAGGALDAPAPGGVLVHRLPFLTTWDPLSRAAVTRLLRRRRPALVQTYMGRATRLTQPPAALNCVHVARLGGYYRLDRFRHADGWIGNTRALCDWMIQQGLPASRVYHIYNFADPATPVAPAEVAARRQAHGIPDDAWVLTVPGRLVWFKGHRHLIAALSGLPARIAGRPWRVLILGDGPLASELRQQAQADGVAGQLVWAGWQRDPAPYYQLTDLVIFPSLDEEPFGNVILDAWAWGRPLLTTRFRGAREVVRHGEDGWCVPCADPPALARGIRTLLEDDALRVALAAHGAQRVVREFDRAVILDRYLELYRSLV